MFTKEPLHDLYQPVRHYAGHHPGTRITVSSPVLLVGIHPGVGRTVNMQWLELWLGVWLKRIILTAVLSAFVAVHELILQNTVHLSWSWPPC